MKINVILEMIERKRVIRNGKWKILYHSTKDGYKVLNKDGVRKEVRIPYDEMKKRRLAAKRAAKKLKGKRSIINAKRKRSLAKRGD